MLTEADFTDSDYWKELAKDLRYDLPRWNRPCTIQDMRLWLDRFDQTPQSYQAVMATTLDEFIELNPDWPLRAFVGLLLEDVEYARHST